MAEGFLEEIYSRSDLLFEVKLLLEQLRLGTAFELTDKLNALLPRLGEECKRYAEKYPEEGVALWECLEEITTYKGDPVWLGDRLEEKLIPKYQKYVSTLNGVNVDDGEGVCLLSSKSGFLTMRLTDSGRYVHSLVDPMWEAYRMARGLFHPKKQEYFLLGSGLGYLPYQLYCCSEGSARIHLFEPREKFVRYGEAYGVLDRIPKENLDITVTDDLSAFVGKIDEFRHGYYIQETIIPFVRGSQRERLTDLIINEKTKRAFDNAFSTNYFCNMRNVEKAVSDFDVSKVTKEVLVVAAGPSLDDSMEYLKRMQGKKTMIAVGTVFAKLMKNGIRPDAVAVIDPQERTLEQFEGLWNADVPLFIGVTANRGFAERYKGEKYLVMLDAFEYIAANYGCPDGLKNEPRLKCGSTVTFLAVSLALFWQVREIELIGVDLAYPDRMSHASDTMDFSLKKEEGLFEVEDVNGGRVYSDLILCAYREELEEAIAANKKVTFVNRSDKGAKIAGAHRGCTE